MTDLIDIELNSGFIRAEALHDGGTWLITFERTAVKNALNIAMYKDLHQLIGSFEANASAKAIIFTGAGGCFTSGNDLADFAKFGVSGLVDEASDLWQFMVALRDCKKPVIMAVDGLAIGIGTTMLLHADAVFASRQASFAMPFAKLGLCPEYASSFLLPKLAGYLKAAQWLMLGKRFSPQEALEANMLNAIVDDAQNAAIEHAQALSVMPATALQTTKALLKMSESTLIKDCMLKEAEYFKAALSGPEFAAAITAFYQK